MPTIRSLEKKFFYDFKIAMIWLIVTYEKKIIFYKENFKFTKNNYVF